jgi:S-adenosylmethionine hydrolase
MTILLFTDFGAADLYVGQVKAVLQKQAPLVPVIDLLHEAPAFNPRAGAHLLAALVARATPGDVVMAVVDPGVGGDRDAVIARVDGIWLVGPDNGLLSVSAARGRSREYWRVVWRPAELSASFHGRDLFAPVAAEIARDGLPQSKVERIDHLAVDLGGTDLGEIVYVDHYGNACTGLRAGIASAAVLAVASRSISHARVFSQVPPGEPFCYVNSLGLIEIAVNGGSAADVLALGIGDPVGIAC